MKLSIEVTMIAAFAAIMVLSLQSSGFVHLIPEAYAYNLLPFRWAADPTGIATIPFVNGNLSSFYYTHTKASAILWNDVGAKVYFKEQSGAYPTTDIWQVQRSDVTWAAITFPVYDANTHLATGIFHVYLNDFYLNGVNENAENAIAHELGHVLGLDHTQAIGANAQKALMWPFINSVHAPMLDDIRGAKAIYGVRPLTPECNHPWDTSGTVTYTGTCTSGNAALPMTEAITTSSSTSKALAVTSSTLGTLPSSNYFLMSANVTATTVKHFLIGAFTTNDPKSLTNKLVTVRMSSDGMYLQTSSSTSLSESPITNTAPTVGQVYFVEVIARNGLKSEAYVWKQDGGPSNPPTLVGQVSSTIQLPWTTQVYYGTGVYTKSATDPTSNYNVSEFYNLLMNAN